MTAYGELATAVAAVRNGAFDYLAKPFDLAVAQRAIESRVEGIGPGPPTCRRGRRRKTRRG